MGFKIDEKDRKILFELDSNSRAPYAAIAKNIRLSKQVVKFRFERMVREGIIEFCSAIWNISMLGYQQYNIYFRLKKTSPEKEAELIDQLNKNKHVNWLVETAGRWDLICATHFKTIQEFYDFQQGIIFNYGEIIKSRELMSITRLYNARRYYLANKKPQKIELASWVLPKNLARINQVDKRIIELLVENARETATEISKKINVSPEIVSARIKKMLNIGLIQSFFLKLDCKKIGFQYYKIITTLKNLTQKRKKELVEFCAVHPNVIYVIEGIGIGDLHIDAEIEDSEGLQNFLSALRKNFPDIIEDFEILTLTKEYKMRYQLLE